MKVNKNIIIAVASLAIILLVSPSILNLSVSGGFSTLSVSNVNYDSNDPTIGGRAWLITVSQNGEGQSISGVISKDQLIDEQDNVEAQNDVSIDIMLDEMYATYTIQNTDEKIYNLEWKETNSFDSCDGYDGNVVINVFAKYCFKFTTASSYGLLGTPSTNFESTLTIKSGYNTETAKLYSLTSSSVNFGDGGSASWVGSLTSGELPPIASDQKISAIYASGWRTIDDNKYREYRTYADSSFESCLANSGDKLRCLQNYNYYADKAMELKSLISQGGSQATVYGTQSSGQVKLDLEKSILFPVITLRLRSDWIGTVSINIPVGTPKIESVLTEEFQTGDTGFITVNSKNIGDADGSFALSVECGSSFSVQGTTVNLPILKPQDITTSFIPITSDVSSKTSQSCSVKLYDRNNPSVYDTKNILVSSNPILLCSPGDKRINGNNIEQCNISGSGWFIIESCSILQKPQRQLNDNIICVDLDVEPEINPGWSWDWLPSFGFGIDGDALTFLTLAITLSVMGFVLIKRKK
ncbi:hypothetical protein ACFL96_12740 [Thermoproteota archaeon]